MENKRGKSLCNNVSKLFEEIFINRLRKYLNFSEVQAGAIQQKSILKNSFAIKPIIQQRKQKGKENYATFIDI